MMETTAVAAHATTAPARFMTDGSGWIAMAECVIELEGPRGKAQLAEHKTEPNSGLGKAFSYLRNHWTELTLFLRQPGAALDSNIAERVLKKAILNRKNALFYKTLNGAGVGDLYLSLIHTCELNGANPFDYLTGLQRHAEELKETDRNGCRGTTAKRDSQEGKIR